MSNSEAIWSLLQLLFVLTLLTCDSAGRHWQHTRNTQDGSGSRYRPWRKVDQSWEPGDWGDREVYRWWINTQTNGTYLIIIILAHSRIFESCLYQVTNLVLNRLYTVIILRCLYSSATCGLSCIYSVTYCLNFVFYFVFCTSYIYVLSVEYFKCPFLKTSFPSFSLCF